MSPHPAPRYRPVDLRAANTFPIAERRNRVSREGFRPLVGPGASAAALVSSLPDFLGARGLRDLADAIARARREGRAVVFAMGAHVVKVGCGPQVIDLIERGLVTAVAVNGAFAIHDYEIALLGETSEEVDETISTGRFGWARETAEAFARAAERGAREGIGLGRALGLAIAGDAEEPPLEHAHLSVLGACVRCGIPATVHVAVGTDIVHMHGTLSAAALGEASHLDFRLLAAVAGDLEGGVWTNVGSAVLLPEVFLKVVSVARNLGHPLASVTAANLDMLHQYRTAVNLLSRPVRHRISITGHHEILLPLLRIAILDRLERVGREERLPPSSSP